MKNRQGRRDDLGAPVVVTLPLLVIGYGNTLRSDDGAGPCVAEAVASWMEPGVRALSVHQLTPELAEPISQACTVVFVDAAATLGANELTIRAVVARETGAAGHASDPSSLLALARAVYDRCPAAWLIAVPAECFDFGETLSAKAARGVEEATAAIRSILQAARERGTLVPIETVEGRPTDR